MDDDTADLTAPTKQGEVPITTLSPGDDTAIKREPGVKSPVTVLSGKDAKRPNGGYKTREPGYAFATAVEICKRLSRGETLRSICEEPDMPSKSAFLDWVDDDRDGLADRYARAREKLMDHWADEIIAIADDPTLEPNDRRVRCDNRRWLMSKLAYRRYGDKLVHSGDPEHPLLVLHKKAEIERLSSFELDLLDRFVQARLTIIDAEPQPESE